MSARQTRAAVKTRLGAAWLATQLAVGCGTSPPASDDADANDQIVPDAAGADVGTPDAFGDTSDDDVAIELFEPCLRVMPGERIDFFAIAPGEEAAREVLSRTAPHRPPSSICSCRV